MAKIICELHIALYSSQLVNLKVIDKAEANNHRNLALFLVLYYIPNWIECPLPFEASRLGLSLHQKLLTTKNQRNVPCGFANLAAAMMNRMEAHFWYPSESLVFLSLFSNKVDDSEKEKCHKAMLQHHKVSNKSLQKLGKLITPATITKSTKLCQLFGPDSWLIPTRLGANMEFMQLQIPAKDWSQTESFIVLKATLTDMQVTNDAAERSILLAKTLHNKLTKKPNQKSALYHTIPQLRRRINDTKKSTLFTTDIPQYANDNDDRHHTYV